MFCVVIPAYQAAVTLPPLIKTISQEFQQNDIFIVDDGSTDATPDILRHYPQIHFIKHPINKGKGAALLSGFQTARQFGYQYAICLDADLQHDPHYIRRFIQAQRINQVDLVLGVRRFDWRTMPLHRILSNTITSFLISLRTGKRVHDSQCGYRLINLKIVKHEQFSEDGFQFESEILIKLLSAGYNYSEVEIPTIYNNAHSSISNVRDTLKFIYLLLKSYLWL
ncbi:MAG: glycosyltransferase family 2 protein [Candidatus Neomarinimicrobiota bacterium]